jgi:hypothetical protein
MIFGPVNPNTNPYNSSVTPDILDIVITKNLLSPLHLTSCSALSSDHIQVFIYTAYRSSLQHTPDRPDFRRTDRANFQTHLENKFLSILICTTRWQSTCDLRNSPAPFGRFLQLPLPRVARVTTRGLRYLLEFRMRYA